ncbi:MAG: Bug family tripartite tricarboxylate transporter substrate binding protein [Xanthobacteraceae bacterium]
MNTLKSTLVVIMSVVAWLGVGPMRSAADTWPQGSVRFIVPLGPGSAADIGARLVADRLAARWGKPVVVENRPGGDAVIGIAAFVSANDDHTLLFAPSGTFTIQPFVHEKLPYDATRDILPIARVSNTIVAIASPASLNIASLGELVALARADPGKLNWTGTSIAEFVFAGFVRTSALAMSRVPYRDAQQALADLAEGRIHAAVHAMALVQPLIQAGRVKALAITNRARAPIWPEVATVGEAGFPELTVDGLVGLFGPRGMASERRERIAADIAAIADDPAVAARLAATGQVVNFGTPSAFAAAIEEQRAKAAAVAALGLKPGR